MNIESEIARIQAKIDGLPYPEAYKTVRKGLAYWLDAREHITDLAIMMLYLEGQRDRPQNTL